jgi:hypothetical protein
METGRYAWVLLLLGHRRVCFGMPAPHFSDQRSCLSRIAIASGPPAMTLAPHPKRNPSSTFWLVYWLEGERALPSG